MAISYFFFFNAFLFILRIFFYKRTNGKNFIKSYFGVEESEINKLLFFE